MQLIVWKIRESLPSCSEGVIKRIVGTQGAAPLCSKNSSLSADTSALEQQINLLVYHLYGLTYDEVLIVDPATPITREKYEKRNT